MKDNLVDAVIIGNTAYDVNTYLNRAGLKEKTVINNGGACLYSLIPASLYNKIGVVTRIGSDFNKSLFQKINIDDLGLKVVDGETTRFIHKYLDKDGQIRTFKAEANDECMIRIEDIPNEYLSAKYIHVCTNFPDIQLEIVKYLKANSSAKISIDTHEAYVNDPKVLEAFNLADIAFIDKEFTNLHNCNAEIKIFKLGKIGCRFISKEKDFIAKAPKCNYVVDKTGAGDTVTGVFLALKSLGKSDEETLDLAVKVATESIKDYGVEHLLQIKKDNYKEELIKFRKILNNFDENNIKNIRESMLNENSDKKVYTMVNESYSTTINIKEESRKKCVKSLLK